MNGVWTTLAHHQVVGDAYLAWIIQFNKDLLRVYYNPVTVLGATIHQ